MKHRRHLLLAATVLSAMAVGPACGADLPVKAPFAPIPVLTWTGFYAGVNIGGGWADVGDTGGSNDLTGILGGGQLGYNWQAGNVVFGLEGDFQGTGQTRSDTVSGFSVDQKLPWFATLRGRLGYAAGPWMLYATGGAAWVDYKMEVSALGTTVSDDTAKSAWTVGGGVEWMFVPSWSAKIEYLYLDTDDTSVTLFGTTFDGRAKNNIVRAGLNFHF